MVWPFNGCSCGTRVVFAKTEPTTEPLEDYEDSDDDDECKNTQDYKSDNSNSTNPEKQRGASRAPISSKCMRCYSARFLHTYYVGSMFM
eukprot:2231349-Pyramimonas_sp.AAC.2